MNRPNAANHNPTFTYLFHVAQVIGMLCSLVCLILVVCCVWIEDLSHRKSVHFCIIWLSFVGGDDIDKPVDVTLHYRQRSTFVTLDSCMY